MWMPLRLQLTMGFFGESEPLASAMTEETVPVSPSRVCPLRPLPINFDAALHRLFEGDREFMKTMLLEF